MKKIVTIVLTAMVILGCKTQEKNVPDMVSLMSYQNSDGTKNIYLADSMKFDMDNYKIIRSYKRGHAFLIPNEVWWKGRFSEKHLLEDPSCYLLDNEIRYSVNELYNYPWTDSTAKKIVGEEKIPELWRNQNYPKRKSYYVCYYPSGPPMYYYLLLIRGDAINFMKMDDGVRSRRYVPLKFIDEKCYYKVLRPVWNGVEWQHKTPWDRRKDILSTQPGYNNAQ